MNHPELITVADFIRYAVSSFNQNGLYYGHGTDNAWDEAVALVLHTLFLPHNINPQLLHTHLTKPERVKLFELIHKRIHDRIPVPYLTNEAWFAQLSFYVDERVLIPRSPIAELIENHFKPWVDPEAVNHILDLCTGSACIAIACAKAFPWAEVDASDLSKEALVVAQMNVLRHNVEDQVHLYQSDLFTALPPKQYDLIVSNPPYVSIEEMAALPPEYHHEPASGLSAGNKGLDFAIRILQKASSYLAPNGILIIEVGNSETALQEHFPDVPFTWLSFERGGGGVCLLEAKELKKVDWKRVES